MMPRYRYQPVPPRRITPLAILLGALGLYALIIMGVLRFLLGG